MDDDGGGGAGVCGEGQWHAGGRVFSDSGGRWRDCGVRERGAASGSDGKTCGGTGSISGGESSAARDRQKSNAGDYWLGEAEWDCPTGIKGAYAECGGDSIV